MRMVMRPRYYCDHCKKAGGSGGHIRRHELGCTANPARSCGICRAGQFTPKPLYELTALCTARSVSHYDPTMDWSWRTLDAAALQALRDAADNCPACMLAAMRQSKAFASREEFNFKDELAAVWKNVNDAALAREYPGY